MKFCAILTEDAAADVLCGIAGNGDVLQLQIDLIEEVNAAAIFGRVRFDLGIFDGNVNLFAELLPNHHAAAAVDRLIIADRGAVFDGNRSIDVAAYPNAAAILSRVVCDGGAVERDVRSTPYAETAALRRSLRPHGIQSFVAVQSGLCDCKAGFFRIDTATAQSGSVLGDLSVCDRVLFGVAVAANDLNTAAIAIDKDPFANSYFVPSIITGDLRICDAQLAVFYRDAAAVVIGGIIKDLGVINGQLAAVYADAAAAAVIAGNLIFRDRGIV